MLTARSPNFEKISDSPRFQSFVLITTTAASLDAGDFRASPGLGSKPGTSPALRSCPGLSPETRFFSSPGLSPGGLPRANNPSLYLYRKIATFDVNV